MWLWQGEGLARPLFPRWPAYLLVNKCTHKLSGLSLQLVWEKSEYGVGPVQTWWLPGRSILLIYFYLGVHNLGDITRVGCILGKWLNSVLSLCSPAGHVKQVLPRKPRVLVAITVIVNGKLSLFPTFCLLNPSFHKFSGDRGKWASAVALLASPTLLPPQSSPQSQDSPQS